MKTSYSRATKKEPRAISVPLAALRESTTDDEEDKTTSSYPVCADRGRMSSKGVKA